MTKNDLEFLEYCAEKDLLTKGDRAKMTKILIKEKFSKSCTFKNDTYTALDGSWEIVRHKAFTGNKSSIYCYMPYERDCNGDYVWTEDREGSAEEAFECLMRRRKNKFSI